MVWTGEPTDAIAITSLRVSPDPPKPGQNLTIYATGTARELIDVRLPIHFLDSWSNAMRCRLELMRMSSSSSV